MNLDACHSRMPARHKRSLFPNVTKASECGFLGDHETLMHFAGKHLLREGLVKSSLWRCEMFHVFAAIRHSSSRLKIFRNNCRLLSQVAMPGNIEIKARISDIGKTKEKAGEIAGERFRLKQHDTFFNSPNGLRLKMRREENSESGISKAMLIAYDRPDILGAKYSYYVLSEVVDPTTMLTVLSKANGAIGDVVKVREVFIVKKYGLAARVHVDEVEGLGHFIEFEVIVEEDAQLPDAKKFAEYLTEYFTIAEDEKIAGAYMNLHQKS